MQMLKDLAGKSRNVNISIDGALPRTPEEVEAWIMSVPSLVSAINAGAGVPIAYTLYPIKPRLSDPILQAAILLSDGDTLVRLRNMISESEEALAVLQALPAYIMPFVATSTVFPRQLSSATTKWPFQQPWRSSSGN